MAPALPSPRANILNVVGVISASLAKVRAKNVPGRLKKREPNVLANDQRHGSHFNSILSSVSSPGLELSVS